MLLTQFFNKEIHTNNDSSGAKNSYIQAFRHSGIQAFKHSSIQALKDSNLCTQVICIKLGRSTIISYSPPFESVPKFNESSTECSDT